MSGALLGTGSKLKKGDGGGPETFTDIAEVISYQFNFQRPPQDVSNLDSEGHEETIPGMKRLGEVQFEVNWIPDNATHDGDTGFLADWESGEISNYKMTFSDTSATNWTLPGWISGIQGNIKHDEPLRARVTLQLTGKPVLSLT